MALFRYVFSFAGGNSADPDAFGEVYYNDVGSISQAVAKLDAGLILNRRAMLSPAYVFQKVRISQVGASRVSTLKEVNQAGSGSLTTVPPLSASVALVLTLASSAVAAKRKLWLRGAPANSIAWVDNIQGYRPTAIFANDIKTWLQTLAQQGFVIAARTPASTIGFEPHKVTNLLPVIGTNLTGVKTDAPHGLAPAVQVILSRLSPKDLPGLNGIYTVTAVADLNTFTILYTLPKLEAYQPGDGFSRRFGYVSGTVIDASISGFFKVNTRQSKAPFTGGRGSRRGPLRGKRLSP